MNMRSIFWLILPVTILMAMIYSSFMLYKLIDPFPSKIPDNLTELISWNVDDIRSLYYKRLDCWELPVYINNEERIISKWRVICKTVRDYLVEANNIEKQNKAVEIAEEIFK